MPADDDVLLTGGHEFLLRAGDCLVAEQIHPRFLRDKDGLAAALSATREVSYIQGEVLLVARYGLITWGHWLGELLPKIVLVERKYPRRFKYILPKEILYWRGKHPSFRAINSSLEAYNISPERLELIDTQQDYRLSLFSLSHLCGRIS